ncbi:GTPase HflX [Acaryochloris marina]|uniref:GTPase HflX n=1 Tax=Acaryochloris marina (strain MBIC 11017) TaxID=329726 RepID=B0C134_ACAM1|nr:GTPase HflX [Acaryochloris marina]ABW28432.1 GTP-binding protein HflX-like protein [Acaryochloris marina MBIC11017]BDM77434.1 GTPase HflX [Acaryochloris marina MBIC10699]
MARQGRLIETIYGNLKGLKSNQIKQLRRLYHQRLPSDRITTSDFAQRLAAISTDIHQPISTYLNRRGQVIRVGVGSPRQTQIPPLELPRYGADRLSGIRCVATTLKQEVPKESALTAMALQRLDALAVLTMTGSGFERRGGGATGYVRSTYLAHLVPDPTTPWTISSPLSLEQLAQQNLMDLVEALESEFGRSLNPRLSETAETEQVLMVGVIPQAVSKAEMKANLAEVALLVESAGGVVVETIHQKRSHPHPQTVVGAGKVKEIALRAQTLGVTLIVFNLDLSPSQVRNLETQIGIRIVDRTEVILDIFAQRAQSQAGKLQVELAQLEYMLPRLAGRGQAMSRLGGGIGTRGPGETKLETERRAIQRRINTLQQAVNQLQAHRSRLRQRRQHQRVPSVAVVGYTNAGKSTLLNVLTNAEAYTADQLFATLDPTTRRLSIPDPETHQMRTLVLTDTVGFIHNLPPPLMDAFRATLEEVTDADVLLHVVDLSHPDWENHLRSVMDLLGTMPITPGPGLIAFNKMDQVSSEALAIAQDQFPQAVFISAQERLGLNTLRQKLLELIDYAAMPTV